MTGVGSLSITAPAGEIAYGEPQFLGNSAVTPLTFTLASGARAKTELRMRSEGGEWRIYAWKIPADESGNMITMNLEEPDAFLGDLLRSAAKTFGSGLPSEEVISLAIESDSKVPAK